MVYFFPEIVEQGLGCGENVGNLFLANMFVITFAGLIVEAHHTIPFDYQSEPILELVGASRDASRQSPHHHLNESLFSYDMALV